MDLTGSGINVAFSQGNHDSTSKDDSGFWLTVGTYSYTIDIENNKTTIDISDLTLVSSTSNKFTEWELKVYLRAEYVLNGVSKIKYFFGDADGNTIGKKSMPTQYLSLLTSSQIEPVIVEHNDDGTRPDLIIRGYCDAIIDAAYVPKNTTANSFEFSLVRIPRGPRVKDSGVWKNTILYVKDNNVWKIAIPYVKDNGTWKIGGG